MTWRCSSKFHDDEKAQPFFQRSNSTHGCISFEQMDKFFRVWLFVIFDECRLRIRGPILLILVGSECSSNSIDWFFKRKVSKPPSAESKSSFSKSGRLIIFISWQLFEIHFCSIKIQFVSTPASNQHEEFRQRLWQIFFGITACKLD